MVDKKYEIRESDSGCGFLCIKYSGFREMYKWWGGDWCLEILLTHVKGIEEAFASRCAGKIRERFNKHFLENSVNGSLYFSTADWVELVENVIAKGE